MYRIRVLETAVRELACLKENIGAAAVELGPEDLREIEGAMSKITIQGDRYPQTLTRMTGR